MIVRFTSPVTDIKIIMTTLYFRSGGSLRDATSHCHALLFGWKYNWFLMARQDWELWFIISKILIIFLFYEFTGNTTTAFYRSKYRYISDGFLAGKTTQEITKGAEVILESQPSKFTTGEFYIPNLLNVKIIQNFSILLVCVNFLLSLHVLSCSFCFPKLRLIPCWVWSFLVSIWLQSSETWDQDSHQI